MILVDSSVWADFFNGYPSPEEIKLKTLLDSRADIVITGIIASEVLSGFKDEKTFEEVKDTFLKLPQAQINFNSHIQAAKMYRNLRSKGITIRSIIDCLIAIIAIEDKRFKGQARTPGSIVDLRGGLEDKPPIGR